MAKVDFIISNYIKTSDFMKLFSKKLSPDAVVDKKMYGNTVSSVTYFEISDFVPENSMKKKIPDRLMLPVEYAGLFYG